MHNDRHGEYSRRLAYELGRSKFQLENSHILLPCQESELICPNLDKQDNRLWKVPRGDHWNRSNHLSQFYLYVI